MLTKGHTVGPHSICRTICDMYAPETVSPGSPKAKDSKAPQGISQEVASARLTQMPKGWATWRLSRPHNRGMSRAEYSAR